MRQPHQSAPWPNKKKHKTACALQIGIKWDLSAPPRRRRMRFAHFAHIKTPARDEDIAYSFIKKINNAKDIINDVNNFGIKSGSDIVSDLGLAYECQLPIVKKRIFVMANFSVDPFKPLQLYSTWIRCTSYGLVRVSHVSALKRLFTTRSENIKISLPYNTRWLGRRHPALSEIKNDKLYSANPNETNLQFGLMHRSIVLERIERMPNAVTDVFEERRHVRHITVTGISKKLAQKRARRERTAKSPLALMCEAKGS
ncbi:hypothetical protein EVAR_45929_1 [Eumeta japonica]|uniref:Uncharacterized protein n=1 Tax=Eumeta variegata TaxID=151549 RepID=A0A4C1W7M0_EUMVA|nr:hypothetical protein EVAR_45929_1 [Eumeta japonica]